MKQSRRCRVRKHNRTLKRGNKKKMRGGLFALNGKKYTTNSDAWSAVLEMMKCDGASLSVISYRSSYGFILLLSIPEGTPLCAKFKDENGKLVYKIVLKIVLLGDNEKKAIMPTFIARKKSVMSEDGINKEVKIQKQVFDETNAMNHIPITPGVACLKVYDTNYNAKEFLDKLRNLNNDPKGGWVSGKGITVEYAERLIGERVKVEDSNTNYEADVKDYDFIFKLKKHDESNANSINANSINPNSINPNLFDKKFWFNGYYFINDYGEEEWAHHTNKWEYFDNTINKWVSGESMTNSKSKYYADILIDNNKLRVFGRDKNNEKVVTYYSVIGYNIEHTLYNINNHTELQINIFEKTWYYYDETIKTRDIENSILKRVINHITELSINNKNYEYDNIYGVAGFGVIAMNYAGNYISDGTNYQIMTLSQALNVSMDDLRYTTNQTNKKQKIDNYSIVSDKLIHAKNKCIEYAIAEMLILLLVCKYINIDAHSSNFLTRFYKPGTSEQSVENIVTWMIDMGKLKSIDDIKDNATYREKYNDLYYSIPGYNKRKRMTPYDNHIDFISSFNIAELRRYGDNAIESIHKLITIIAALDYVINEKDTYKHEIDKKPQCAFILKYLINTSNIRVMIKIRYMIKRKPMDTGIKSKYLSICNYFNRIANNNIKSVDDKMEVDDNATTTKKTKRDDETIVAYETENITHDNEVVVDDEATTKKMRPYRESTPFSINF